MMEEEREHPQRDTYDNPVGRAEDALEHAGESLGVFAVQAGLRLQRLFAQSVRAVEGVATPSEQKEAATTPHTTGGDQRTGDTTEGAAAETTNMTPAEKHAEELVDAASQRLGDWGHIARERLQTLLARLQEEGEDIWAEAQNMRRPDTTVH